MAQAPSRRAKTGDSTEGPSCRYGHMYRVFLIPTEENPKKELWLEAHAVYEAEGGTFWHFVDADNRVIRRVEKSRVESFITTPDRRKPRGTEGLVAQNSDWNHRESDPDRP